MMGTLSLTCGRISLIILWKTVRESRTVISEIYMITITRIIFLNICNSKLYIGESIEGECVVNSVTV
jgi:hypothetical protein